MSVIRLLNHYTQHGQLIPYQFDTDQSQVSSQISSQFSLQINSQISLQISSQISSLISSLQIDLVHIHSMLRFGETWVTFSLPSALALSQAVVTFLPCAGYVALLS